MNQVDIIVVGNGILGITTAYSLMLEDPNLNIAIIGPALRPEGATTAAGAI